jgi:Trypsin-like peptidase domain
VKQEFTPEEIERGHALAAGPLGQELTRFTLRFGQPILIASPPSEGREVKLNNGTATLVRLGETPVAITCAHVLSAYRERKASDASVEFQIGNLKVEPDECLIDENSGLDLATLNLSGRNFTSMSVRKGPPEFHEPVCWPPTPIAAGDHVTLSGYPGFWRQPPVGQLVEYDTLSVGGQEVTTVGDNRFICQFEREFWIQSFGYAGRDLHELGGMSGGPVFVLRALHWEFAGIIYQASEDYDLLYIRPATLIRADGTIIDGDSAI